MVTQDIARVISLLGTFALIACTPGGSGTRITNFIDTSFPLADGSTDVAPDVALPDADAGQGPEEVSQELPNPPEDASACVDGSACDDGNNCTVNDQCIAGICQGQPLDCGPEDGLPCTSNACQDGACVVVIAAGFCAIDGACWSSGQPNPVGGCESCDPTQNATTWTGASAACDDGDPCTLNDTCTPGGGCAGTPVSCPPLGGNGCQVNQCVNGTCQPTAVGEGGACDDGDACTTGEICTGGTCGGGAAKDSDKDGAVDEACGGNDCNDGTSAIGPTVTEVCSDGVDNDCDGLTDSADTSDCGTGNTPDECAYHTDCYPDVCAQWPGTGKSFCSSVCAGDGDCDANRVCTKLPGSANVGFCRVPIPDTLPNGASCSAPEQCASSICVDGVCTAVCMNEVNCPGPSNTCALIGDAASGTAAGLCLPNGTYFPNGQQCTLAADLVPGVCASGHCDLMAVETGQYYCSPLCKSQADCAPSQQCDLIYYMENPNTDALLYDPIIETAGTNGQKAPRDAAMGCFTRVIQGGTLPDGQVCTSNEQCLGGRCLALKPGDSTAYCTQFCTADSDCGAGMACKIEMIGISSDFLQNFGTIPTDYWSYVRLCKFAN